MRLCPFLLFVAGAVSVQARGGSGSGGGGGGGGGGGYHRVDCGPGGCSTTISFWLFLVVGGILLACLAWFTHFRYTLCPTYFDPGNCVVQPKIA